MGAERRKLYSFPMAGARGIFQNFSGLRLLVGDAVVAADDEGAAWLHAPGRNGLRDKPEAACYRIGGAEAVAGKAQAEVAGRDEVEVEVAGEVDLGDGVAEGGADLGAATSASSWGVP